MIALVCATQADALKYQSDIDAKLGYPRPGKDVGGGIHVPPALSQTIHQADVRKHPTLAVYAYMDDTAIGDNTKTGSKVTIPLGATVQTLDATWTPVVP